jgi:plastocyanin
VRRRIFLLAALLAPGLPLGLRLGLVPRRALAAEASVSLETFAFVPASLTVAAGTKVTWTNRDDTPHTVTSVARPPVFRSGALDTDDVYSFVFDKPGSFGYFCSLHPHMQGTVVVT